MSVDPRGRRIRAKREDVLASPAEPGCSDLEIVCRKWWLGCAERRDEGADSGIANTSACPYEEGYGVVNRFQYVERLVEEGSEPRGRFCNALHERNHRGTHSFT